MCTQTVLRWNFYSAALMNRCMYFWCPVLLVPLPTLVYTVYRYWLFKGSYICTCRISTPASNCQCFWSLYIYLFVSGCTNHTIRLVGGRSSYEGRVDICINGVWGSVCHGGWDSSDARVVCRQLGLPYTGTKMELCSNCYTTAVTVYTFLHQLISSLI